MRNKLVDELERTFDSARRTILLKRIQELVIEENAYEVRPVFSPAKVIGGKAYQDCKPSPHLYHVTYATRPTS